jgi:hypothetical protein
MIGSGLGGGGSTFVNAMQLCTLELQQQQGVASLQSPNGITNNGLFSTNTITTNPATTTNSFTQFPATTTSNGNFGPFQNLNPGFTSNSNNPLVSSNGVTTIP